MCRPCTKKMCIRDRYNPQPTEQMQQLLTDELKEEIASLRQRIVDGDITVPETLEELESFTPPAV